MRRQLRTLSVFAIVGLMVVSTACTKLVEEQPTPTPLPTPADSDKPIFTAERASLTEIVKGLGRVAATDEATLYFSQSGRLKRLHVDLNQMVKKDDLLAELETGTLATEIEQARINVDIARLNLQRATEKANFSSTDAGVHTAQARIAQAEASRAQAVAALQKAQSGATAADIQAADAAIAAAQANLEKAQADLAKLKAPRSPDELAAARAVLDKARAARDKAQSDYDKIAHQADAAGTPQALALQQATSDYEAAQARFNLASAAASPEDVAAAEKAVQSAQAAVESARAKKAQIQSGANPADVASAQATLEAANANLEAARADYEAKVAAATRDAAMAQSASHVDVLIAQKRVELASVGLTTLEDQLADSQLKAPFDGIVTSASGREGDIINAYTPVVVMADPKSLLVALEVPEADMKKIALGQDATLTLDTFRGQTFDSKVIGLPNVTDGPQPQGLARTVKLEFTPPGEVELGAMANVTITTQKKDNVVTIPLQGLRKFGGRNYVQVLSDTGRKREVDVEVGIVTDRQAEIVKGITEGTQVVSQ